MGVFGEGYEVASDVVVILSLTMLLATACGPVDSVLLMAGRSWLSLRNNAVALVVNVGLNVVLIPLYGIRGAAIAWSVAIVVRNLLPLVQVRRHLAMWPVTRSTVRVALAAVACFGAVGIVVAAHRAPPGRATSCCSGVGTLVYLSGIWSWRDALGLEAFRSALRRRPPRAGTAGPAADRRLSSIWHRGPFPRIRGFGDSASGPSVEVPGVRPSGVRLLRPVRATHVTLTPIEACRTGWPPRLTLTARLAVTTAPPAAAAPTDVVINEMMFHAVSDLDGDDYLELYQQRHHPRRPLRVDLQRHHADAARRHHHRPRRLPRRRQGRRPVPGHLRLRARRRLRRQPVQLAARPSPSGTPPPPPSTPSPSSTSTPGRSGPTAPVRRSSSSTPP